VPVRVFITAHPEHAVESFALETLDFIVKPVKLNRFTQTVARIEDYMELRHKAELSESSIGGDSIYIKEGHSQTKIKLHDILYLEALKDYTRMMRQTRNTACFPALATCLRKIISARLSGSTSAMPCKTIHQFN
jgi:DNA-binding LytR/AlgR family response regulator